MIVLCTQLEKGKCLGQIDMGYSVISMQAERLRIDIDVGDQSFVYHLKVCGAVYTIFIQCFISDFQYVNIRVQ